MTLKMDHPIAYSSSTQGDHSESSCGVMAAVRKSIEGHNYYEFSNTRPHSSSIICAGVLVGVVGSSAF